MAYVNSTSSSTVTVAYTTATPGPGTRHRHLALAVPLDYVPRMSSEVKARWGVEGPVLEWLAIPDCGEKCDAEHRAAHQSGTYTHVFSDPEGAKAFAKGNSGGGHKWKVRYRIVEYGQWKDYME